MDKDLLRYGKILDDEEYIDIRYNFIRNRIIWFNGNFYIHKMVNGEIIIIKEIEF